MLELKLHKELVEAGCDEAGRGCLAGPVYAAAVILPDDFHNDLLNRLRRLVDRKNYRIKAKSFE